MASLPGAHQPWRGGCSREEAGARAELPEESWGQGQGLRGGGRGRPPREPGWPQLSLGSLGQQPFPSREPDSTYFDLPQPRREGGDGACGAEGSMDVFHLQRMTTPSVMVSGVPSAEGSDWGL